MSVVEPLSTVWSVGSSAAEGCVPLRTTAVQLALLNQQNDYSVVKDKQLKVWHMTTIRWNR
jgi:hypothetical protein